VLRMLPTKAQQRRLRVCVTGCYRRRAPMRRCSSIDRCHLLRLRRWCRLPMRRAAPNAGRWPCRSRSSSRSKGQLLMLGWCRNAGTSGQSENAPSAVHRRARRMHTRSRTCVTSRSLLCSIYVSSIFHSVSPFSPPCQAVLFVRNVSCFREVA
jgi:hypothetical protein